MTPHDALDAKLDALRKIMRARLPALLAVSGGVDSRLLASLAWEWDMDVEAVLFAGLHMSPGELAWARAWLEEQGGRFHTLRFNPVSHPQVHANCRLRCYYCKRSNFAKARFLAEERSIPHVWDGSNVSDLSEHRPGRQALTELGVHSPFALAGFTKADIRAASRLTKLDRPNQPSRPCLLTRLEYGLPPTEETLSRLGLAEDALTRLGLRQFRLRLTRSGPCLQLHKGETATWSAIREWALTRLEEEGFERVEVTLNETISGFFDRDDSGNVR